MGISNDNVAMTFNSSNGSTTIGTFDQLKCPVCGGENLHQKSAAFENDKISIYFTCEQCDRPSQNILPDVPYTLDIVQYKGSTFIKWIKKHTS